MGTAFTVIIALLVFGFLIFIHEFGHYITARLFKVTINEFSIGMGPKLVTYTSKKTNIQYSLGMFPIGGYVAMVGEDEESDDPNAFNKKPAWQRFIITAAGATVNIVAGFLAMIIIVSCVNTANTVYGGIVNDERLTESYGTDTLDLSVRSDASGLRVGDEIVKINGKRVLIVDDVISTGASLKAIEELVNKAGGNIVGKACVLAEGDATQRDDIIYLEKLPVFPK